MNDNTSRKLAELALIGLEERYGLKANGYRDRLENEIEVYSALDYSGYLLELHDVVLELKKECIHFRIIGPCNSSLVFYCLGLSELDPIRYGFLFERFEMPLRRQFQTIEIILQNEESFQCIQKYIYKRHTSTGINFRVDRHLLDSGKSQVDDGFLARVDREMTYEEDIMVEIREMSGCSWEDSYLLMKAIVMRKNDLSERERAFKNGCISNGISADAAEERLSFWKKVAGRTVNKPGYYARILYYDNCRIQETQD